MTSKLDTAGLVERLRPFVRRNEDGSFVAPRDADLSSLLDWAEALTRAAAPASQENGRIGLTVSRTIPPPSDEVEQQNLFSAAQLSALQERAERAEWDAEKWRSAAMEAREGCNMRSSTITSLRSKLEAAEARVAELTKSDASIAPNDTIPGWAREMAAEAHQMLVASAEPNIETIAIALVAAERRGLERGLKQARDITYGAGPDYGLFGPGGSRLVDEDNDLRPGSPYDSGRYDAAKLIDASIRKLMESSDGNA